MLKSVLKNVAEIKQWFSPLKSIYSYDWETTSLSYFKMKPVGLSFCDGERACYIDISKYEESSNILTVIKQLIFKQDDILFISHNQVFDLKCCHNFCLATPKNIFCTYVGAYLLDENYFSHSLKDLAQYWLKVPADQIKKWEEVSQDINSPKFADYAMNDAIWAYQLYELESKALKKQNLEHLFYNVEMPFQFVLRDLEVNGIAINENILEEYKNECYEALINLECNMLAIFGKTYNIQPDLFGRQSLDSPINFGSTPQLVDCIEQLGFEIIEKTKPSKTHPTGQKSVDKHTLTRLKGEHEFIDLLIRYRKLSTMYNTFIGRIEDFIDSDGRVRPSYNMVRTGRLSCSKPNLQNQPNSKKEKLEFDYRKIFIPGD